MRRHLGITAKMTILVLGGAALVLALILGYSYRYSRDMIEEAYRYNAQNLTDSMARRIEQEFRAVAKVPQSVAIFLETRPVRQKTLLKLLDNILVDNPELYGVGAAYTRYGFNPELEYFSPHFFRESDAVKFSPSEQADGSYLRTDRFHTPQVMEKAIWGEPRYARNQEDTILTTYSYPLFGNGEPEDAKDRFLGVVTADISLQWLTELVSSVRPGRTGYAFVISARGTFVTHPREELIMRQSIFSYADQTNNTRLREIGHIMQKQDAGFVDYGKTFGGNEAFLAFAKIPSPDWSVGAVFPKAELFAEADMLNNRMRLLAIGGGLLLFVVSLLVSRSITGPLRRMARLAAGITNRIGSRQHSEKLSIDLTDISPRDEIGQLARAFMDLGSEVNRYMEKRNFIRATFGRYLSKEMVTRLLGARNDETPGERTREITVLVSSLRGFQTMCAGLDTGQSVTLINRYLTEMVDILLDGEGMVDAIHRDGLVALFGAHRQTENHAEQAVVCALKMQMALDKINSSNHEENLPHLEMGVAISSGPVFIGAIDHQSCDQCTLNGSEAELAQAMEPYALGGRILVSPSTRDNLAEKIAIAGTVRVTPDGWRDEVTLSLIEGIEGDHWIRLSKRDEQPVPLRHPLEASATPIEGAGGAPEELSVTITAISMTAAMVTASQEFPDWTQLRVQLLDSQSGEPQGNFFGTVVEVRSAGTGYEHQIRLGSMCAHSHQVILDATGRAKAQLI